MFPESFLPSWQLKKKTKQETTHTQLEVLIWLKNSSHDELGYWKDSIVFWRHRSSLFHIYVKVKVTRKWYQKKCYLHLQAWLGFSWKQDVSKYNDFSSHNVWSQSHAIRDYGTWNPVYMMDKKIEVSWFRLCWAMMDQK